MIPSAAPATSLVHLYSQPSEMNHYVHTWVANSITTGTYVYMRRAVNNTTGDKRTIKTAIGL